MNRDRFADLALSYLPEVTAFAYSLTRTRWDGDDLVQETYERAFSRWETLREPERCRAWLFQIAKRRFLDRQRSVSARPELRLVGEQDARAPRQSVSAADVERLDARELEAALARLPGDQRQAVLLCDVWGFTYGEIADIEGVPVGTVRSRIARARAALLETIMKARKRGTA